MDTNTNRLPLITRHELLRFADKVCPDWLLHAPEAFYYAYNTIVPFLVQELKDQRIVFPPLEESCFRAFNECSFAALRVVILSTAPYSNGTANGLCYDVDRTHTPPDPLRRILCKIKEEYPETVAPNSASYLGHLPSQGVLLLNMALSTRKGNNRSHMGLWRPFTERIINAIAKKNNIAWIQWGPATHLGVPNSTHFVIRGPHPAVAAGKDFDKEVYFKKVNRFLAGNGYDEIIF